MLKTLVVGVVAVLALAGCSDAGSDPESTSAPPDIPTEPPALWNPCDGLDATTVSRAFATSFTASTGSDAEPTCSFTPPAEGGPAVDVNYQLYPGTLDDLIASFGVLEVAGRTMVNTPTVAGADDARVVSDVNDGTLAVTGFVRNGRLVQVVNAIDPTPFDQAVVQKAVTEMLAALAAHAAGSGIGDDSTGGSSPTDAPTD